MYGVEGFMSNFGRKRDMGKERVQKRRTGKIRNQLLLTVGLLTGVAMLALSSISLFMAYTSLYEADSRWLESVSAEGKTGLESWIELNVYSMQTCESYLNERPSKAARTTYLESVQSNFESIPNGVYVGYMDNFLIYPGLSKNNRKEMTDIANMEWYKKAEENPGIQYLDTYIGAEGEVFFTISCLLKDEFSVLAADISLAKADQKLAAMNLMDGQAILINQKGDIISATDADKKNKALSAVYPGLAADIGSGEVKGSYLLDSQNSLVAVQEIGGFGWKLLVAIPESTIFEDCIRLGQASAICFVIAMVLLMVVLILVINRITKPIIRVNHYMKKIAEGDLTESLSIRNRTEIGTMVQSVNGSVSSIRRVVTDIKSAVDELERESEECRNASEVLEGQTGSINQSSEMISDTMEQLSISASTVAKMAEKVNEAVGGILDKSENAGRALESTMEATHTGQADIQAVAKEILGVKEAVMELSETVKESEVLTAKISDIISVIQNIASQTNLLALNASIEAARAGEAGRGFAVVAEEIKNLADNSSNSAQDIARLIKEVEQIIGTTVLQTKENVERIQLSVTVVDRTTESFGVIADAVDNINNRIKGILLDIKQVDESAQTFAAISQQQMAGVEEAASTVLSVKDAAGSNLSSVNSMKGSIEQLHKVVEHLKETSNQFRVEH